MPTIDPLNSYLRKKTAAQQKCEEDDHALVTQWQQAHQGDAVNPALTHQVLQRFQPTIQTALKKYKSPLTGPGLNAAAKTYAVEALRTYDPSRGASFNTHLTNTLRRLHRENNQAQASYVPEDHVTYFGPAQRAHDEFVDEFGRTPTPEEHEQRLNEMLPERRRLAPGALAPILALKRNTVVSSNFASSPNTFAQDLEQQNVALGRHDLAEPDRKVYDLIYGNNVTSTGDIAKRLGMSDPAVSRAKTRIEKTLSQPVGASKRKKPGALSSP
jgi:DNA-directed RNA polymerase specialized sigma subunit